MGEERQHSLGPPRLTYRANWVELDKLSELRRLQRELRLAPEPEPEPDPTHPAIAFHRHAGCGHDCVSGACGLTASKHDAMCPYCEMVIPDRRWSEGTRKF